MATADIVARLQLRAEQFTSETGKAFADLNVRARSSAAELRNEFGGAFAEVQKLAQTALVLPRTASGSLNLSGEIAQLREAAAATDQRAQALRELSIAQTAAAASANVDAQALRLEADASAVGALAAERDAAAIRQRIAALTAVQNELNKTTSATVAHANAQGNATISAGQQRAAMQQLGFQLGDVAQGFASGISPMQIFAQQSGQVIQALQLMTNKTTGFLGFLAGPWGAVLTASLVFLSPLVAKLFEFGDGLDGAIEKLKKEAAQQALTDRAKEAFGKTTEGVTAAINEQRKALDRLAESEKTAAQLAEEAAQRGLRDILIRRQQIETKLQEAKVDADNAALQARLNPEGGALGAGLATQRLDQINAELKANAASIETAQRNLRDASINLAVESGKKAADPLADTNRRFDQQIKAAEAAAAAKINAANGSKAAIERESAALAKQTTEIEKSRAAAIKAQRDALSTRKGPALGTQLETEQSGRLLDSASRYRGLDERRDNGSIRDLLQKAGVNVDPKMVAWCAAFVNAVLATNGLPGTGSLSARSFLGYGEATNRPVKGDIVVSRRGTGDQGHVGFYEGTDANGNVRVLGGNTGNKVGTQTVNRSDVLGFRRAPSAADGYKAEQAALEKLQDQAAQTAETILRINEQWDEQPGLIDRAAQDTRRLNDEIATLKQLPVSDAVNAQIAAAERGLRTIQEGLNRPFNDYIRAQNESLTLQRLSLQGRDVEAAALQDALRFQQQGVALDKDRLGTILQNARAQEAISRALDDQRRIVGLYTQAGSDFQQSFGSFLDKLNDNPGDAFKGLAGDLVGSFTKLRNNILSEQLLGGIDRDIEDYVRRASGKKTPAEMLSEQAGDAGDVLESSVDRLASALDRLSGKIDGSGRAIGSGVTAAGSTAAQDLLLGSYAPLPTGLPGGDGVGIDYLKLTAANDNGLLGIDTAATKFLSATEVFSFAGTRLVDNFTRLFGIELPADLKKSLGDGLGAIISGASYGQLGGGVFASITGGKNNKLTSSIGGILGQEAGKSLAKGVTGLFGKALGPLGGIVGGVLGGLLGGLFAPTPKASAGIVVDKFGVLQGGKATGSSAELRSGAATLAGSVASAVQQIADQLGANVTGNSDVKIGTYKGKFRINTTGGAIGGVKGSGAIEFETEQQAIAAAVSAVLQDGVLSGISAASLKILASGQDLQRALAKATSIEAIPKQLKAYLDPVGAAIDEVNRKYKKLVEALEEGGATAEQRAQAEQLYNLELAETKEKTASASQALKDFLTDLKLGSNSPFSLRDQEATARAQLAPFLNQIAAGSTIDQAKFEDAARAFLDVNRQLFGSTNAYFDALALVQDATNKAIAGIDNVKSVAPDVANPFAKSTAEATATTADRVQTGNEIMSQVSDTLRNVEALLDQIANDNITRFSSFIGEARVFGVAS